MSRWRRRSTWRRLVIAALVAAIVFVVGGPWFLRTYRQGVHFSAVFSESVGVYKGSEVRVLGVRVGTVDRLTPQGTSVLVSMHLDPGVHVRSDTYAVIISPALVGDRYVQLTGTYNGGARLAEGARIPADRTRTPVELDELYRNLTQLTDALGPNGANSDGALNRLLVTAAANLKGNGTDLNVMLQQLSKASATFAGSKDSIASTLSQLSTFSQMLQQNNNGVITVNRQLAAVTQVLADDRTSFAEALRDLGTALGLVQTFVRDNRAALSKNVSKLNSVAAVLASQRDSLTKALNAAPVLVQNFLQAYDPQHNVLRGRTDLNEVGAWNPAATGNGTSARVAGPPTLLPGTGVTR